MENLKWDDIKQHKTYLNATPDQREVFKNVWWEKNVATRPEAAQLTPDQAAQVRTRLFGDDPPAPEPKDIGQPTMEDYGRYFAAALNKQGQTFGRALDVVGLDSVGQSVENYYKKEEAEDRQVLSDAWNREQEKKFLSDKPGEIFGDAWTSPAKIVGTILGSLPGMALGMGTGAGIAGGLMKAGVSAGLSGIIGGAIGEGGVAGAEAAKNAYDAVMSGDDNLIAQSPEYREVLQDIDETLPPAEQHRLAKAAIAERSAWKVGALVGGGTAVLGAPSGAAMGKIIGGEAGKSLLTTAMKQGALETMQEMPQSALETYQQNVVDKKYTDANRNVWEGVAEAAVEGGVSGFVMGAGMGGGAHGVNTARQSAPEGVETADNAQPQEAPAPVEITETAESEAPAPLPEREKTEADETDRIKSLDRFLRRDIPDADRTAIETDVLNMSDLEAVRTKYAGDSNVDKFARNFAELKERTENAFSGREAAPEGAPEPVRQLEILPEQRGKSGRAYTPKNTPVDFDYAVLDAGELVTSHDDALQINPEFPQELQPRDRTRAGMQVQINNIANNIIPEKLGESAEVGSGAPIIGPDMLVESGNGRTIALRNAYKSGKGASYKQYLADNAERFGLSAEQIAGLENPVLVRVRKTNVPRTEFVKEANQSEVAGMAPGEMARSDAGRMTADDMDLLMPDESGSLSSVSNHTFIQRFLNKIGTNETAGLLTADGNLTKTGYDRVQSAVFAKAYNDDFLIELQSEEANPDIRNVLNALTTAAPEFAKARGMAPDMGGIDITRNIIDGAKLLRQARSEGVSVQQLIDQQGLFEQRDANTDLMARFLDDNIRSGKRMGIALKKMGELVRSELGNRNQNDLFGDRPQLSPETAINRGIEHAEQAETGDKSGEPNGDTGRGPAYAAGRRTATEAGITVEDIREVFRGREVRQNKDGSFEVNLGKNFRRPLKIQAVNHIDINRAEFEISYRRKLTGAEAATGAAGRYASGKIEISRIGDKYTLSHESFHHLKELGIFTNQDKIALQRIGKTEEQQAAWIEGNLAKREEYRSRGGLYKVLQKIGDFVDKMGNMIFRQNSGRQLLTEFESGEIYNRDAAQTGPETGAEAAEMYSVPDVIRKKFHQDQPVTLSERAGKAVQDFAKNWRTRMFDRLSPIRQTGEKAYILHRLTAGTQGIMQTLMEHGKLKWDKSGVLTTDTQGQGFVPWMKSLKGDAEKLFYWMSAKRAESLESEGREKWLDKTARKEILDWVGAKPESAASWEELNKQFQEFNQSVLKIAEESGLIKRGEWAEKDIYIPFYRIFEDEATKEEFLRGPNKGDGKYIDAKIKALKGGEAKIGDPVQNVLKNWTHLITESVKNTARAEAFENAVQHNILSGIQDINGKNLPIVEKISKADILKFQKGKDGAVIITKGNDDNVLSYNKNGERIYYKVNDPELYAAMSMVSPKGLDNAMMKLFRVSKRMLTAGATFGPAFRVKNMLRDTVHSAVISKNFVPFWDSARGFVKAWQGDEDFVKLMASGGGFGADYMKADDPAATRRYIEKITKKEGKGAAHRILDSLKKILEFWEKVGMASEQAARVALYQKRKAAGADEMTAAYEARDLLDFSMQGNAGAVQYLIQTVPFLNARMQGLYRLGKSARHTPKGFAVKGGLITIASLALWASNRDDDRYKALEDWEKRSYYHFWAGEDHYRIPKPFEVGAIFSTFFEAAADSLAGDENFEYFVSTMRHTASDTFMFNPMPQALKPAYEALSNYNSFTGREIESAAMQRLQPGARSAANTPETLKRIGAMTNLSPAKMEYLINGYFSTIGEALLIMSDAVIRKLDTDLPVKPAADPKDMLATGWFFRGNTERTTKYNTRFYEAMAEVNQLFATIQEYKKTGNIELARKIATEGMGKLRFREPINRAQRKIAELNRRAKLVTQSRAMSAERKKEILDKINMRKQTITEKVYTKYAEING